MTSMTPMTSMPTIQSIPSVQSISSEGCSQAVPVSASTNGTTGQTMQFVPLYMNQAAQYVSVPHPSMQANTMNNMMQLATNPNHLSTGKGQADTHYRGKRHA